MQSLRSFPKSTFRPQTLDVNVVLSEQRKDTGSLEAWASAAMDEHFGQKDQLPMRLKLVGAL